MDKVVDLKKNESLTAVYTLNGREEFLKDHFSGFPVMPGVLLLESLKQTASALLTLSGGPKERFYRFTRVQDVKFGQFVKPGSELKLFVRLLEKEGDKRCFEGRIDLTVQGVFAGKALSAWMELTGVII